MNTYMNLILEQRFFRLLSEYSQRKVSASEFTEAIEELATHVADFGINEQDYSILLRYFSFGLHRLKSYRVRFEQEKNAFVCADHPLADRSSVTLEDLEDYPFLS